MRAATMALEDLGEPSATVRALDGNVTVQVRRAANLRVSAPEAVGPRDGKKRPPAATLEAEERAVVQLARSMAGDGWCDHSRSTVRMGASKVDGANIGLAPVSLLVEEGAHAGHSRRRA